MIQVTVEVRLFNFAGLEGLEEQTRRCSEAGTAIRSKHREHQARHDEAERKLRFCQPTSGTCEWLERLSFCEVL